MQRPVDGRKQGGVRPWGLTRWGEAVAALVVTCAITVLMSAVCFRLPLVFTLGPIAGIAGGLACRRFLDAALAAAAGVGVGSLIAIAATRLALGPIASLLPSVAEAALCAAVIAGAGSWLRSTGGRTPQLLAFLGVALIIASGWSVSVQAMSILDPAGVTAAKKLTLAKPIGPSAPDEDLYQDALVRMHGSMSYYQAMGSVLSDANGARPGTAHDVNLAFAPSFRLPTMLTVMAQLPADGISLVMVTLLIGTIASVSAYWLARAYVPAAFALVATAGITSMYSGLSEGQQLFQVEVWTGAFVVLSLALFVWARRAGVSTGLLWAAAGAATVAAVTRELAVVYLLLGLAATLAIPEGRKTRQWLAWVVGLVVFAGTYAAHVREVAAIYPTLAHGASTGSSNWLDLSALGGAAVVDRIGASLSLQIAAVLVFVLAGILGSVIAPKELASRLYLGVAVVGGLLVVTFFHPPGPLIDGLPAGYWGHVVMASVFAAVPLAAALVSGWRDDAAETRAEEPQPLAAT